MLKLLCAATFALTAATSATAVTITFDELTHNGDFTFHNPLSIDGFSFVNSQGGVDSLGVWGSTNSFNADPGGATLFNNYPSTTTTVTRIGGGTFDLTSIDLADVYNNGAGGDILFTFVDADGTTSQTVTIDNLLGLETFVFNRADLLSFSYLPISTQGPWVQVDNVVIDAAIVPEPASWALMIGGFGLVGAALRRRVAVVA